MYVKSWVASGIPLLAGGGVGSDLPTAKPAPMFTPLPVFNWTGFYRA